MERNFYFYVRRTHHRVLEVLQTLTSAPPTTAAEHKYNDEYNNKYNG
jgi:hypothetical protein